MTYKEKIQHLIEKVPTTIVDWSVERVSSKEPTQAFSEFLTNREQGDWAERLILQAINSLSEDLVAVHYGKSDTRIAGEEGFKQFYKEYQDELDKIGKRPDILVLKKSDYDEAWNYNISSLPNTELDAIVHKAIAGVEIRSSSFLIGKYDNTIKSNKLKNIDLLISLKNDIIKKHSQNLIDKNLAIVKKISSENLNIKGFRFTKREKDKELRGDISELRKLIEKVEKRDFLSITVKQEDIKVVSKWIETYGIPHYYFQVFFDKVYGISFHDVLEILGNTELEDKNFYIEKNKKNQEKTTIHISSKSGKEIAHKVDFPNHKSQVKELERGRLLFHVTFEGGTAYLNETNLFDLLNLKSS